MKIDSLDKSLLYQLELDSSQSLTKLSKKLRRSKEVILYRLKRLQDEKILIRCNAIVDMSKLGYFTFRVYIKWQNITLEQKEMFYEEISKNENIWTLAILHGKWDFAFFIGVKSSDYITEFHDIWRSILLKYKDKIAESKIAIYAPVYNFNKKFFCEGKVESIERVYGQGGLIDFDKLDEKIINLYANDVRQPFTDVARKLKVSPETIRQRIRKLEQKKVFAGYKVDLDFPKLGFQGYRVDFFLNSIARNKELFEYLKQHKYFYQVNQSIGGADFETEIIVKDLKHLLEILEGVVKRFSDVIRSYEYFGYSGFPKLSMVPD
jgi:DNA-binding Lrp family transcriptional regulator